MKKFTYQPILKAQFGDMLLGYLDVAKDYVMNESPLAPLMKSNNLRGRKKYNMHEFKKCNTGQCAKYANNQLQLRGRNIYGSAWNQSTKPIMDGYRGLKRPKEYNFNDVHNYNLDAAENLQKRLNINNLNKNRVYSVSMYYTGSPYQRLAFKQGTNNRANTHTGNLLYDGKQWVIEHNFHGTVMRDPLSDLLGSGHNIGVTQISYKQGEQIPKAQFGWIARRLKSAFTPIKTTVNEIKQQLPERKPAHAIYLHYPNFVGRSSNALKIAGKDIGKAIGDPDLPVGHAASILVDDKGNATYYEYGRYAGEGFGHVRSTIKGGNWRRRRLPRQRNEENDSAYVARIQSRLPYTNTGSYQAMTIPDVDTEKATKWIEQQANDSNRPEYSIANNCSNGACTTILPFRRSITFNPTNILKLPNGTLLSQAWSLIPNSTGNNAAFMRTQASKVYNMNNK